MKRQLGYIAFTAVILLLCLVPSAGMFLSSGTEAGGNEVLSRLPVLRDKEGSWNPGYLTELANYAEDNYFLRQKMVTAWSVLNQYVLDTSIAEDVLLGEDGWLYFADTLDDYTGKNPMSRRDILSAARNLTLVSEYCESQGAKFLFTIAPNKNSIYPQQMPDFPLFSRQQNANALRDALAAEGTACLDLFAVFAAQDEVLYFAQDSHWNSKGAALAADAVNAALERQSGYFAGSFTPQKVHKGDLYSMLRPTGEGLETDWVYDGELTFTYDAPIRSAENLTIMTSGSGEGSLLMFRDSFGNLLYPYLADSFASALFSRSPEYKLNLIGQRAADYVVVELVERNIHYLLEHIPVMPAPLLAEFPAEGEAAEAAVPLTLEPSEEMPGYILAQGTLPEEADAGAFIALCSPAGSWEAFRLADGGFGLYIPESAPEEGGFYVVTQTAGRFVSYPASQK